MSIQSMKNLQTSTFLLFTRTEKMGVDVLMQLMANLDFEKDLAFNIFYIYLLLLCGRAGGACASFREEDEGQLA